MAASTLLISACTDQAVYLDNLHKSQSPVPTFTPALDTASSDVNCIELETTGTPWFKGQGSIKIIRTTYQIGIFSCANSADEIGIPYVESFVLDQGVWASNGLVSGTDELFELTGECTEQAEEVSCPANVGSTAGQVVIYNQDGGPGWRFVAS